MCCFCGYCNIFPFLGRHIPPLRRYHNQQRCLYSLMVLCAIVLVILLIMLERHLPVKHEINDENTQGYILHLGWNPSSCLLGDNHFNCTQEWAHNTNWAIRSFRPQPATLHNCPSLKHFRPYKLLDLAVKLETAWPNIFGSLYDEEYWHEEWIKYGTCTHHQFEEWQYFEKALELYGKFQINKWFRYASIQPSSNLNDLYDKDSFRYAIESHIGQDEANSYAYICKKLPGTNINMLEEIVFCISSNGNVSDLRTCPSAIKTTCGKKIHKVYYPN